MKNIWSLPDPLPAEECFEDLLLTPALRVERIISAGQVTPPGLWCDQVCDEWVLLLQGKATVEYESGGLQTLSAGDYLLILAHQRHRVTFTSVVYHNWLDISDFSCKMVADAKSCHFRGSA
jgi:cupin 2 domain-containing protein